MNKKSFAALLLAALMLGSLMPVSAEGPLLIAPRPGILIAPNPTASAPAVTGSSFSDISDPETARHAEILRLLGVTEGIGGGRFDPAGTLTRAQFTKMVIVLLGQEKEVQRYAGYTIFPDVRGSHWAAGYINYALRGCPVRFISGRPDGTFGPDAPITLGEAVTILMRLLGYTDDQVGLTWPDGYLATAASVGLTDGLEQLGGFDAVNRAQAARLFVQLLETPLKSGGIYAGSRFTLVSKAVILSADALAQDGTAGALETTEGTRKVKNGPVAPLFTGLRGTLLLDGDGLVCSFLPEDSSARTLAAVTVRADGLTDSSGTHYPIPASAGLYLAGNVSGYGAGWTELIPGTVVTVYYDKAGRADYLFAGSASGASALVQADGSAKEIDALAGGARYTIYKNGEKVTAAALRQYDVVTYDSASAVATVCDLRLAGCIETVSPGYSAPETVTVLGKAYPLLPEAAADLAYFRQGDPAVLLLTADGRVAGIQAPGTLESNIWGIVRSVSAGSATVELHNGVTVTGDPELSVQEAARLQGALVTLSSDALGKLTLTPLSTRVKGPLDPAAGTLNGQPLAPGLRLFERVTGTGVSSALREISIRDLPAGVIESGRLLCAGYDYLNRANVLVLEDITGDGYEYGFMTYTQGSLSGAMGSFTSGCITVENGSTHTGAYNMMTRSGLYGGMILSAQGDTVVETVALQELKAVPAAAFRGTGSVTVQGTVYPLSGSIKCYNKTLELWVSLADALAYGETYDLYFDRTPAQGGKIRVLVVQ